MVYKTIATTNCATSASKDKENHQEFYKTPNPNIIHEVSLDSLLSYLIVAQLGNAPSSHP